MRQNTNEDGTKNLKFNASSSSSFFKSTWKCEHVVAKKKEAQKKRNKKGATKDAHDVS